jgi:hypothetical protein
MNNSDTKTAILKTLWRRLEDGRWGIRGGKSLALKPQNGCDPDFFKFESEMELFNVGSGNIHEMLASFGPTDFVMKQSILPVVAWVEDEDVLRCIGTAFVISCTGYVITACHVLIDPIERNYGKVVREGNILKFMGDLHMGVLIPISPAYDVRGYRFFPFQRCWYWGEWKRSPLLHKAEEFTYLTDIAVCKIGEMPNGVAHQPLSLSLNKFQIGEKAYVFGYAEMDDLPVEGIENGIPVIKYFTHDLYVSIGEVAAVFPENHEKREVSTPGPCFEFRAKIPGKMSGGPILGADGAVTRASLAEAFQEKSLLMEQC